MRANRSVFVDTSAWIAYASRTDAHHGAVVQMVHDLTAQESAFVTSSDVLDETVTRLAYDVSAQAAVRFYRSFRSGIEAGWLQQLWGDEDTQARALKVLAKFSDKRLSFTDAGSAVLMKREKISRVLTLDSDFKFLGFEVLPAKIG